MGCQTEEIKSMKVIVANGNIMQLVHARGVVFSGCLSYTIGEVPHGAHDSMARYLGGYKLEFQQPHNEF